MNYCEHELICEEEEWFSDSKVKIKMRCSLCEEIFEGVVKSK